MLRLRAVALFVACVFVMGLTACRLPGVRGDRLAGRLTYEEIDARMTRPIEESIYDPTLTKEEKIEILQR